jgi:hypothetical protein
MIRMFVRHEVADFDKWLKAYHDFEGERGGFGVVGDAVCCSVENGNDVTVTHDFESLDEAKAFMGSPRLKEVMTAAGVTGEPTIWFTNLA